MIDVKNVLHLVTLFETGTVTEAAEKLHITQPTLTSHLSRLESILGERLFIRTAKGLEPTPMGKSFYKRGKAMLAEWKIFDQQIKLLAGAEVGELRLLCGASFSEVIVPNAVAQFLKQSPGTKLRVDVINPETMLEILQQGDAEIVVGAFPGLKDPAIQRFDAAPYPIGFFARPKHPLLDSKLNTTLSDYPLASPEIPAPLIQWLETKGMKLSQHQLNSDNFRLLKDVARDSDLIVAGPHFIFSEELEAGTLQQIPLEDPPLWRSSILVAPAAKYSKVVQLMVECLKQEFILLVGDIDE